MLELGPFSFLNPAYLIGMLSAAIPLIIHLSRSRRTKKMRFSTTRFFTDQFLRSYRMSRLRELLLLACRMLLFGLFAAALAQPLFRPKNPTAMSGRGARTVVLVLDNSASMGYVEDGITLLERARRAAREILDGLREGEGDTAAVVLAGRRADGPQAPVAAPVTDLGEARQVLDSLQAQTLGTDLTAAIRKAELIALASPAPNKEVYVISDLQDSGWELNDQKELGSDPSRVSYFFVQVRPRKRVGNVGVTAVQFGSARPMAGVPFTVRPLLSVRDPQARSVPVRLYIDGRKVGEQRVERIAGGRWAVPRFTHTFTSGGWHSGHIEVEDPALPGDNRRYFALEVLDRVSVLAVNGAPSAVPRLDELFFLRLALTVSPEEGMKSPVNVKTIAPAALANEDLTKFPLVILANVESLTEAAVAKLEDYADRGGSVFFFLGDKVNASFYNQALAGSNRRNGGLLPGTLAGRQGDPASEKSVATISEVNYAHPALAGFEGQRAASLAGRSITFKALWGMEVDPGRVLMKVSTGAPLLAEKAYGRGRVVVFASTADRDWTNFPIRPAFLPWLHRLVAYLAQDPLAPRAFHHTGAVARLPAPSFDPAGVVVKKPDGRPGYASAEPGEVPTLLFGDTAEPGVYTLLQPGQKGELGRFAVNLDPYESDTTFLDDVLDRRGEGDTRRARVEGGLRKLLDRPLVTYVDEPERTAEAVAEARGGLKLWDWVLLLVLAIALFEPWLANRISARHYTRPRGVLVVPGPETVHVRRVEAERPEAAEVKS